MRAKAEATTKITLELDDEERRLVAARVADHQRYFTGDTPADGALNALFVVLDHALNGRS